MRRQSDKKKKKTSGSDSSPSESTTFPLRYLRLFGIAETPSPVPKRLKDVEDLFGQYSTTVPNNVVDAVLSGQNVSVDEKLKQHIRKYVTRYRTNPIFVNTFYQLIDCSITYKMDNEFLDYCKNILIDTFPMVTKLSGSTEMTWSVHLHSAFEALFMSHPDIRVDNNGGISNPSKLLNAKRPDSQIGTNFSPDKIFFTTRPTIGVTEVVYEDKEHEEKEADQTKLLCVLSSVVDRIKALRDEHKLKCDGFDSSFAVGGTRSGSKVTLFLLWKEEGETNQQEEAGRTVNNTKQQKAVKEDEKEPAQPPYRELRRIVRKPKETTQPGESRVYRRRDTPKGGHNNKKNNSNTEEKLNSVEGMRKYGWTYLIELDLLDIEDYIAYMHTNYRVFIYCKRLTEALRTIVPLKANADPKEHKRDDEDIEVERLHVSGLSKTSIYYDASKTKSANSYYVKKEFSFESGHLMDRELCCYKLLQNSNATPRLLSSETYLGGRGSLCLQYLPFVTREFEEADLVVIYRKIFEALFQLAKLGIVHNDLSRGNILVYKRKGEWEVRLIDFSFSWLITSDRLDERALFRGTRGYIAPEVWEDEEPSCKSDIFSVGVMLAEDLLGSRFAGQEEMLDFFKTGGPKLLSGDSRSLVMLATAFSVEERGSVVDVLLHRYFNSE